MKKTGPIQQRTSDYFNLTTLIRSMSDGACIQSLDSQIIDANDSFASMLNLPLNKIIGRSCQQIFNCSNDTATLPSFCVCAANYFDNHCDKREFFGRRAGQRLQARVSVIRNEAGQPEKYIMLVRDISDVILREREVARAEQLTLIGELAAGLAHEIKNPLAGIQGAIDIFLQRIADHDPDHAVLSAVRHEVSRIDNAIQGLIERARIGRLMVEPASLNRIVNRAVLLARNQFALFNQSNINLELQTPTDEIITVVDTDQLETAVLNLIINSVEAIEQDGTIIVRLLRQQTSSTTSEAVIEVEDDGRGIPSENLTRIFSPFHTTKSDGTGLGLSSVRRIARAHQGRAEVKSQLGFGSLFSIHLPLR